MQSLGKDGAALGAEKDPKTKSNGVHKARALYAYTTSPDESTDISFAKDEILDILDNSGDWWQARKEDGTIGSKCLSRLVGMVLMHGEPLCATAVPSSKLPWTRIAYRRIQLTGFSRLLSVCLILHKLDVGLFLRPSSRSHFLLRHTLRLGDIPTLHL